MSTPTMALRSDDRTAGLLTEVSGDFVERGFFGRPWQEKNQKNSKYFWCPAQPESAAVCLLDSRDVTCPWQGLCFSNPESKLGLTLSIGLMSRFVSWFISQVFGTMKLDRHIALLMRQTVRARAHRSVKTVPFSAVFSVFFAHSTCLRQIINPADVTGNKTSLTLEEIRANDKVVTLGLFSGASVVTSSRHDNGRRLWQCHHVSFNLRAL